MLYKFQIYWFLSNLECSYCYKKLETLKLLFLSNIYLIWLYCSINKHHSWLNCKYFANFSAGTYYCNIHKYYSRYFNHSFIDMGRCECNICLRQECLLLILFVNILISWWQSSSFHLFNYKHDNKDSHSLKK